MLKPEMHSVLSALTNNEAELVLLPVPPTTTQRKTSNLAQLQVPLWPHVLFLSNLKPSAAPGSSLRF